jgi:hypothetical protein
MVPNLFSEFICCVNAQARTGARTVLKSICAEQQDHLGD